VTKALVEALRTQKVDFDEDEASARPGVIILNPRKYRPERSFIEREKAASPSRDTETAAQPL
jgi:hypothetical protein